MLPYEPGFSEVRTEPQKADQMLGFDHHGGLGKYMREDLEIASDGHIHTIFGIFMPDKSPKLGPKVEERLTEVLGNGGNLFERLANYTRTRPDSLPRNVHSAMQDVGTQFDKTNGAFHGVDVIRKDQAVVLHVHSIVLSEKQGKPHGPEHVVIPIGQQSVELAEKLHEYLEAATGMDVPQLEAQ